MNYRNLEPEDVALRLKEEAIVLIDVREPPEYAAERIHGALLYPLSTFDPHALPDPGHAKSSFIAVRHTLGQGSQALSGRRSCLQ